ncbi:RluA family pseudouridine synthase [Acinetobacter baylyi]|uniref:RluA family pseudouridine synthase n=1 Tax=Acinetobacter baylyi TaxID=202950 RepID=UPI0031DEC4C0
MITSTDFTPPMLHGVSASKAFLPLQPKEIFKSVFEFLCLHFPHISASEWQQRFNDGLVFDAQGHLLDLNSPYQANTHIFYYRFLAHEIHVPFEHSILFENHDLLVVDKPHFLTISPTGKYVQETLLVRLKQQTGNEDLTPIHRLDRETAGVVLFCKRPESRGIYQTLFAKREVHKIYHAIAAYNPLITFPQTLRLCLEKGNPFYTMQVNPNGQVNSETCIECLAHHQQWAKYRLSPSTGKQHQLRLHLSFLNIPIKNDPFYPVVEHKADDDFSAPLQLLAKELSFFDPITQSPLNFKSHYELNL